MQESARITTLAKKFAAEFYRRWRALKGAVRERIVEEDHYALMTDGGRPGDRGFAFATDAEKVSDFMDWYDDRVRDEVFEPVGERQLREGGHWTAKYVRGTNASGLRDAGTRMREAGIDPLRGRDEIESMFNLPVRTDQLERLYTRAFNELQGITSKVGQEVSRELTSALAQGENPRKVARRINDRIDKIGATRSRTLARTELSRSYNHGSLLRYRRNGIDEVEILNTTPCGTCKPYVNGGPYSLDEAMGIIPIHPNCQGTYTPVVGGSAIAGDSPGRSSSAATESDAPRSESTPPPASAEGVEEILAEDAPESVRVDNLAGHISENTPISEVVDLSGLDADQAEVVGKEIYDLNDDGQLQGLRSFRTKTEGESGDEGGLYRPDGREVIINPDQFDVGLGETTDGWRHFSTSAKSHTVTHEVGHHRHWMQNVDERAYNTGPLGLATTPLSDEDVYGAVSVYAATSPVEFVAETYAGLRADEEYPEDIMTLYNGLTGGGME